MKIEWLVIDETAIVLDSLAELNVLFEGGILLGVFLANSGHICGR